MKCSVYVLCLNNGQFYIGSSVDVSKRILEHQRGMTKSIAYKRPVRIIFQQEFENEALARRVEYKLKKLKSRKIITDIISDGRINTGRLLGSESNKILGG